MRRRRSPWRRLHRHTINVWTVLVAHPKQFAGFAFSGFTLVWLIFTTTLPHALAETRPELALWLNSNNPVALLTTANKARTELLALSYPNENLAKQRAATNTASNIHQDKEDAAKVREKLRNEIRLVAIRIITSDPTNATAYRFLAETSDEPAQIRRFMQEAVKRSRHETAALFWLMNDSFEKEDYVGVVEKADVLLRTKPGLISYVIEYLGKVTAREEGRIQLVSLLAKRPPWRGAFFNLLPGKVRLADTPFKLMLALKRAGSSPSNEELAPYLNMLVKRNYFDFAYNAWLQFLPENKLVSLKMLNNANFADEPSTLPFDWQISRGLNATVEFEPQGKANGDRTLSYNFSGGGRIKFPQISQLMVLTEGGYRFSGEFRGVMTATRGVRWQFHCVTNRKKVLGETEMIRGNPRSWRSFSFDFVVLNSKDCHAQQLRLFHDARSASEELVSGNISFRHLKLVRAAH